MTALQIAEPGVYDISNEAYQADPIPGGSLSSSGARRLISPSCPAKFLWEKENRRPNKRAFDIGHAAHREVLGVGEEIVVVDAPDWRTKAAKEQRDAAYAEGKTPILAEEAARVRAMADAILADPMASALFNPAKGRGEQTLVWIDESTGVTCRARLDWLPDLHDGRLIIPDYKTCESAEPGALRRSFASFGYYMQADWYQAGAKACGLAGDTEPAFVFVAQEKAAPHLITVVELDAEALELGRRRNREAIDTYVRCMETGTWPSYSAEPVLLSLPAYLTRDYAMESF